MIPIRVHSSSTRWSLGLFLVTCLCTIHYCITSDVFNADQWIDAYGLVPLRWWNETAWQKLGVLRQLSAIVSYAYLHDDWFHCLFNAWWLLVFAPAVHARFGGMAFWMVYTCAGIGGGATYLMSSADSLSPLVGASANISGILGAYWVGCRQHSVALLGLDKPVHGGVFTALFIGVQIMLALLYTDHHVGIAFLCHVVGWMVGVLVALGYSREQQDTEMMVLD